MRKRNQHDRDHVGMLAALGQIDPLIRCGHGLEFVHVGVDGIHHDLARENRVLGNRGALVLARRHRTHADSEQRDRADYDAHPPLWSREQVRNTYHSAHPGSRMHGQPRYKEPRYAVSRPPMVTAAHNRQVAETSLLPREETAPFASQLAASWFMVRWKYHVTTKAM